MTHSILHILEIQYKGLNALGTYLVNRNISLLPLILIYSDDIYAHHIVFGLIYFSNGDFPNIALFVGWICTMPGGTNCCFLV